MNVGRSAREEAEYRKVLYPGTETLINRLGIRDPSLLEDAERQLVDTRIEEDLPLPARDLTYTGFKAIHRHLFQDVYDWAGEQRAYTTGRGPAPFARPEHIASWMEDRFAYWSARNISSASTRQPSPPVPQNT